METYLQLKGGLHGNSRQNVMRGLTYNAENALYNGVKILGYTGKPNCKYEIDDNTAPIVRRIFSEYTQGVPMQKICNGLNEAGLRTNKGNKFSVNSMRGILANRAYIGECKFGDVVIPDGMPPIIDEVTFQAAHVKLEANKRGGKGAIKKIHPDAPIEDYWLSGKLYCGLCGETVQGMSGTSRGGRLYYYYSCKNHRKHKCALKSQRKGPLERIVLFTLDDLAHDTALRFMIAEICYAYHQSQNDNSGDYEASIKTRLKEVESKLKNIMKALEAGIFNDTTAEHMKGLESQKSMLRDELLAEQNCKRCCIKLSDIVKFMDGLVGNINDPDTRIKLLDTYVDRIYVYPDKLVITFNYTDDKRELPFEEMEAFIDNRQKIMSMLDEHHDGSGNVSPELLASLIGNGEDDTDFFP